MRHVILRSARLARRHRRAATLALYGSVAAAGYGCAYEPGVVPRIVVETAADELSIPRIWPDP